MSVKPGGHACPEFRTSDTPMLAQQISSVTPAGSRQPLPTYRVRNVQAFAAQWYPPEDP
jgi:hypothetical protein